MTLPLYKALEALQTKLGNPVSVTRWPGGECNRLYRLNAGNRTLALRLNHANPEQLGVNREAEQQLLEALAGQAWAPTTLEINEALLLSQWYFGSKPASGEQTDLETLTARIHCVQATNISAPTLSIAEQILRLKPRAPAWPAHIESALHQRCQAYRMPEARALCHHDWHPGNLIEQDAGWTLLDWEFAGLGDPAMDLASACLGFELSAMQSDRLRTAFDINEDRFLEAHCLMQALAVVWYQANPDVPAETEPPTPQSWFKRWGPVSLPATAI